jgi:catechol 2,3-dioxygenase-like lactoylglutathione lyase family enzyme
MPDRPHLVRGVDHAAFPTFDPAATVRFYRDVLGFPLAHAIAAVGWGPADHPDFIHFFFDIGDGSRIAFFYYFGVAPYRDERISRLLGAARHLAIHVESREALDEYERRLDASEWRCEMRVPHETIESIYVHDPNGFLIELTCPTRPLGHTDRVDAELTVAALLEVVAGPEPTLAKLWARKAELITEEAARELAEVGR